MYKNIKAIYQNYDKKVKSFLVFCYCRGYKKIDIFALDDIAINYDFDRTSASAYNELIKQYSKPERVKNLLK